MPVLGEDSETGVRKTPQMGGGQNTKVLLNLSLKPCRAELCPSGVESL